MMKAMEALNGDPVAPVRSGATEWDIVIDNDRAVATQTSDTPEENPPQEFGATGRRCLENLKTVQR